MALEEGGTVVVKGDWHRHITAELQEGEGKGYGVDSISMRRVR